MMYHVHAPIFWQGISHVNDHFTPFLTMFNGSHF